MVSELIRKVSEKYFPIFLVGAIILGLSVGILLSDEGDSPDVSGQSSGLSTKNNLSLEKSKLANEQVTRIPPFSGGDHFRGNEDAKVTIIEYSDYQCPYCAQFHPVMLRIIEDYKEGVRWVYRHYPVDLTHPLARDAAEASECIAELGGEEAFWKFTDKIFEDQKRLNELEGVAESIGINMSSFKSCVDSGRYKEKVQKDYEAGVASGVTGTPGNFYLNDKGDVWYLPGAFTYEDTKVVIEYILAER